MLQIKTPEGVITSRHGLHHNMKNWNCDNGCDNQLDNFHSILLQNKSNCLRAYAHLFLYLHYIFRINENQYLDYGETHK